jgi:hypothetical protein
VQGYQHGWESAHAEAEEAIEGAVRARFGDLLVAREAALAEDVQAHAMRLRRHFRRARPFSLLLAIHCHRQALRY